MALSLMLLCLVASAAAKTSWKLSNEDIVGRLGATKLALAAACDKICEIGEKSTPYPGACNLYLDCVQSHAMIYVRQCGDGLLFDPKSKVCNNIFQETPCGSDGDPCETKVMLPDMDGCKYHQCENRVIKKMNCPNGMGFDATIKQCTVDAASQCRTSRYKELEFFCRPLGGNNESYNKTVSRYNDVSGVLRTEPITFTLPCPAGLWYPPDVNNCTCIRKPEREVECKFYRLVDLSSQRDTWARSSSGDPELFKLEGNLTLDNNGQPFVTGSDNLHVPALEKNELGSKWNLSLTFAVGARRADGTFVAGFPPTATSGDMALVDNSACETPPTFGCHLRRQGSTQGYVICSVNNHTVTSRLVNVARPVAVTLSRDGTQGLMLVRSQDDQPDQKPFTFADQEQVQTNDCPLTLGYSRDQEDFSGYMDDITLFKYACN